MGRGRSPAEIDANLNLVATRQGNVSGTELEKVGGLELDGDEQITLRQLVEAERKRSSATGLDADDLDLPSEHLTSLESKGLVEQDRGSYCATTAGIQLIGAFASAEWSAKGFLA